MIKEEKMKTRILCYGDSNTWGAIPITLGTNDLKTKFNSNLEDISRSLQEKYIDC